MCQGMNGDCMVLAGPQCMFITLLELINQSSISSLSNLVLMKNCRVQSVVSHPILPLRHFISSLVV